MQTKYDILERVLILTESGVVEAEIIAIYCNLNVEPTYKFNTTFEPDTSFRTESQIWRTREELVAYVENCDIRPLQSSEDDIPF